MLLVRSGVFSCCIVFCRVRDFYDRTSLRVRKPVVERLVSWGGGFSVEPYALYRYSKLVAVGVSALIIVELYAKAKY